MYCEHCYSESPSHYPRCIKCGKPFVSREVNVQTPEKYKSWDTNILGWIAGLVVGWYSGIFLLALMALTFAISWVGKKFLKPSAMIYRSAIAFQVSPILMVTGSVIGVVYMTGASIPLDFVFIVADYVVPISGLIWLVVKPSIRPVLFLTIYQVCVLGVNVYNLLGMDVGSPNHKALATYVLWRLFAVFFMWSSYLSTRKSNAASDEVLS